MKWLTLSLTLLFVQPIPTITAPQTVTKIRTLQRRYIEGMVSHYVMTGDNDGWRYTIQASDVVKRDTKGRYYEEIGWSDFKSSPQQSLTPASLALRQTVSLDDPASYMKIPNLTLVQPLLIGPITDTLTFYSDLLLALQSNLVQTGQTAYVSRTKPNSWADGSHVLIGQDVVDFSLKVEAVNPAEHIEAFLIQHVPPQVLHIQLPAKWMQKRTPAEPYNFVQVSMQNDQFIAEIGQETFDVHLVVDTRDGRILSAIMHNPVVLSVRTCKDRELTQCGQETSKTILRTITWKLAS